MKRAIFLILAFLPVLLLFNCKKGSYSITGASDPDSLGPIVRKPNIYIYPIEKTNIDIQIVFPNGGKIIESIPVYNNSWEITVAPSGLINNQYEYLFYEAQIPELLQREFGWIISGADLSVFFMSNLKSLLFSNDEITDFIEYWIPLLDEAKTYLIYPQFNEDLNNIIQFQFSIEPDNLIRVFYVIEEYKENEVVKSPHIPSFKREGFTILEWGVVY